ncbi:MAG: hypothetical protein ACXVY6_09830 [Gaiellaceae bacterium]
MGIDAVELRTLDGVQIVDHSCGELAAIRVELDRRGFRVCAVASPFLKCHRGEEQGGELAGALRAATVLGAPIVRAFGYWRERDPVAALPDLGRVLRDAAADTDTEQVEVGVHRGLQVVDASAAPTSTCASWSLATT